jgi:hypothetical protein
MASSSGASPEVGAALAATRAASSHALVGNPAGPVEPWQAPNAAARTTTAVKRISGTMFLLLAGWLSSFASIDLIMELMGVTTILESGSRIRLWGLLIVAAVLGAGAVWAVGALPTDPNDALVRALAVDTLTLEHRMSLPDVVTQVVPTAAEAARLRERAAATAIAHYRGPLLATRSEQILAAVNDRISGSPSTDGGAKDISFLDTMVNDTSARVRLKATTWARTSQNGVMANPISTDTWTFDFANVDGQWYVVNVDTDFHG